MPMAPGQKVSTDYQVTQFPKDARALLTRLKMSQAALAREAGITTTTMSRFLNGKYSKTPMDRARIITAFEQLMIVAGYSPATIQFWTSDLRASDKLPIIEAESSSVIVALQELLIQAQKHATDFAYEAAISASGKAALRAGDDPAMHAYALASRAWYLFEVCRHGEAETAANQALKVMELDQWVPGRDQRNLIPDEFLKRVHEMENSTRVFTTYAMVTKIYGSLYQDRHQYYTAAWVYRVMGAVGAKLGNADLRARALVLLAGGRINLVTEATSDEWRVLKKRDEEHLAQIRIAIEECEKVARMPGVTDMDILGHAHRIMGLGYDLAREPQKAVTARRASEEIFGLRLSRVSTLMNGVVQDLQRGTQLKTVGKRIDEIIALSGQIPSAITLEKALVAKVELEQSQGTPDEKQIRTWLLVAVYAWPTARDNRDSRRTILHIKRRELQLGDVLKFPESKDASNSPEWQLLQKIALRDETAILQRQGDIRERWKHRDTPLGAPKGRR